MTEQLPDDARLIALAVEDAPLFTSEQVDELRRHLEPLVAAVAAPVPMRRPRERKAAA